MKKIIPTLILMSALYGCGGRHQSPREQMNTPPMTQPEIVNQDSIGRAHESEKRLAEEKERTMYQERLHSVTKNSDILYLEPNAGRAYDSFPGITYGGEAGGICFNPANMNYEGNLELRMITREGIDFEKSGVDTSGWSRTSLDTIAGLKEDEIYQHWIKKTNVKSAYDSTKGIFSLTAENKGKTTRYELTRTDYDTYSVFELAKMTVRKGDATTTYKKEDFTSRNSDEYTNQLSSLWNIQENEIIPTYLSAIQRNSIQRMIEEMR